MALVQTHATFSIPGELSVGARPARFYTEHNWTITHVRASVGTAPQGSAVVVDVERGGTSIFGTRPRIIVGTNSDKSIDFTLAALSTGQFLTIAIDQVGSSFPGADLTVTVWMQRTV